jgi:hypothetical protein
VRRRAAEVGVQTELARKMGVSKSVISRDVKVILSIMQEAGRCVQCGGFHSRKITWGSLTHLLDIVR